MYFKCKTIVTSFAEKSLIFTSCDLFSRLKMLNFIYTKILCVQDHLTLLQCSKSIMDGLKPVKILWN